MENGKFFSNKGPFTIKELAKIGNCEIYPKNANIELLIENLAPIEIAGKSELSFVINSKYLKYLADTKVTACIVSKEVIEKANKDVILLVSANPYKSYAMIASKFYEANENRLSDTNNNNFFVHETAKIGKNCLIEPFVYVGENAIIGDNVILRSNVYIGNNVFIGNNSSIGVGSVIRYAKIGENVIIHPGVKIGQEGFGFASDHTGHLRVPQLGKVIIEDNVDIGANSCIDRGTNNDTIIGRGTQIDNLVQIGHNVQIGINCVIVAQVGIAGSTKIGNFTLIGGQVGIAGHLNIGSFVQIAAKSGVKKDIKDNQMVGGFPAVSIGLWRKQIAILNKLVAAKTSIKEDV